MRLPALLHVDLDLRVSLAEPLQERFEIRLVGASQQREDVARLRQQALDHRARDLLEIGAACDRLAAGQPEVGSFADREAVQNGVARGDRHLAGRDGVQATRAVLDACPSTAVVCLTASANVREMDALREAGAVVCLTKDQELDEIVAAIHRAVGASR